MALDSYSQCPCGSGKKIKFCCSKDIVHELEKAIRAAAGEQRVAALDQVNKLLAEKPDRPALLVLKIELLAELGNTAEAEKTIGEFLKVAPKHPAALAYAAMIQCRAGKATPAIKYIQRIMEEVETSLPSLAYRAIGQVASGLLETGDYLAARAHAELFAGLNPENPEAAHLLAMLLLSNEVPMILRDDFPLRTCPANVRWKGEFAAAHKCALQARWMLAAEQLTSLDDKVPNQPEILWNLAVLQSRLGDPEAAVTTWRRYAALPGLSEEAAVAAEALAQTLDSRTFSQRTEELVITYPVRDAQELHERLLSDRRLAAHRAPTSPKEDEPPPKGTFLLLDKPLPETGAGLQRPDVPTVLAALYLYGKQTDRGARLEVMASRDEHLESTRQRIAELLGDLGGAPLKDKVVGDSSTIHAAMTWKWRMPPDTSAETIARLTREQRHEVIFQRWPELPQAVLDEKTPRQVATEPAYRVRLLAAILLLELTGDDLQWEIDFNNLRSQLGLPPAEEIDGATADTASLPVIRLARLRLDGLSDDALFMAYRRAANVNAATAIRRISPEVLARPGLSTRVSRAAVYGVMSRATRHVPTALDYLRKARDAATSAGESPATWLLTELSYRLQASQFEEIGDLLQLIKPHADEPGVTEDLYETFAAFGLVTPEGNLLLPRVKRDERVAPAAASAPAIWTPGSDTPVAAGEPARSKLWVPGS